MYPTQQELKTYGWLDGGYMGNPNAPASRFNGPYNAIDRNELMGNQAYLVVEKTLGNCGFGIGGRIDLLYGFDYLLGQSVGMEVHPDGSNRWNDSQYYGLAMPQAYVEAGSSDLSVKAGHFYSIVGFEGLTSPSNFFYSKAYSYQFAGPFTHWGGLATAKVTDNWQLQAGVHNGWDQLDGIHDHPGFIGGVKYTSDCQCWWSSFAVTSGEEFTNTAGLPTVDQRWENRTRYSFIVDKKIGCSLEYVFHHWLGFQADGASDNGGDAYWYGIDQYLYQRVNDRHRLGGRFEWFRDEDGTRVGLNRPNNPNKPPLPGSYFSMSFGDNYTPYENISIRPEVRWDFYDGPARPYDDGTKKNQVLLGLDVVWQF